jgi:hypothetical protein
MKSMSKWVLGAAVVAGALGLGTTNAQAAEFGVYVRGPVAYAPPCPGEGYVWIAGFWDRGYWFPGRWEFRGYRVRDGYSYYHQDDWRYRRDWDERRFHHDRDGDRDHFHR